MSKQQSLVTQSIARNAVRMAMLCVVTALVGCSRGKPELTAALMQAFVDARAKGLETKDAPALCSHYADGAKVKIGVNSDAMDLTKQGYCDYVAHGITALAGGPARVEAKLAVKSVKIAGNGRSADLELEQVDVVQLRRDSEPFEVRTQISTHVESIAGTPLVTRETRKMTQAKVAPAAPATSPHGDTTMSESERREQARELRTLRALGQGGMPMKEENAAPPAPRDLRNEVAAAVAQTEECAKRRSDLPKLEQLARTGPGEIRTDAELKTIAGHVTEYTQYLAENCQ